MAVMVVDRITMAAPVEWTEPVGDEVASIGSTPVPGDRSPNEVDVTLISIPSSADSIAERQRLRAQYRSLLNNRPRILSGVYIAWDDDPEQDGWYVPAKGSMAFVNQAITNRAVTMSGSFILVGRRRTHRRGISVYLRDRRVATQARDALSRVYSTDFSGLTPQAVSWLPSTVTDLTITATASAALTGGRAGYGGASVQGILGATDLAVATFEQAASVRNLGDVVIYDRRGTITAPAAAPDAAWQEVYGPDWACASSSDWVAGSDVPVLENSLVRVRWSATNTPGLVIDRWSGSAWVEQGKALIERVGDTTGYCDVLVSASVVEWTQDRAVVRLVMRRTADSLSREEVFVTLQRGWTGPRIEIYPAPKSGPAASGAGVHLFATVAVAASSAAKVDAAAAGAITYAIGNFTPAAVGAATFTGENWLELVCSGGTAALVLAPLQAGAAGRVENGTSAYGSARNGISVRSAATAGYVSAHLGASLQVADQQGEAEAWTLGAGTSSTVDGAASGGNAATSTRTADAIHVSRATWPGSVAGKYRVFALVKTSASTINVYAKTTATTGATKTSTSTTYVWLDLGDIVANGSTLEIHAWATAAATISVDRIEAHKVEDRTAAAPLYDGARDHGLQALYDSRSPQTIVSR